MKGLNLLLPVIVVLALSIQVDAQSFYSYRRDRDFLVSIGSGTSNYYGEMVNPGEWGTLKPNIVVGAEYYWTNKIALRGEVTWFMLSGSDANANDDRRERNLSFRSSCFELNVTGAYYLLPQGVRFYQRAKINPYVFAGIGLVYFNPKAEYQGEWVALAPLHTEGVSYSRFQPVIPFGGGVKIKVNPFFNAIVELGYRQTFTDYLDDVSAERYLGYPGQTTLTDPLAIALSDRRQEYLDATGGGEPVNYARGRRGNPKKNDSYLIMNVKLQYYLPYQVFAKNTQRKLYRAKRKSYYRRK